MQQAYDQHAHLENNKSQELSNHEELNKPSCHHCHSEVSPTADICEHCGSWLLALKCCFCYTDVEESQKFCSECGNPPFGIICTSCNTRSYFDFCPQCNTPLTEQARAMLATVKATYAPDILKDEAPEDIVEPTKGERSLNQTSSLAGKQGNLEKKKQNSDIPESNANPNRFFIPKPRSLADNLKAVEEANQLLEVEKSRKIKEADEKHLLLQLKKNKEKTFETNQEARKYFDSLKLVLPKVVDNRRLVGWLCNFADCLHPGGPKECGDPSHGGTWIYEGEIETTYSQVDI